MLQSMEFSTLSPKRLPDLLASVERHLALILVPCFSASNLSRLSNLLGFFASVFLLLLS